MAVKTQYYDIKFPFTANNLDGFFIDLNNSMEDKKTSEILHVILTPKRSRIRKPDFGTDLIKYIYEPSDEQTWDTVKSETIESVNNYVSGVNLTSIDILRKEDDDHAIFLDLKYQVITSKTPNNKQLIVKL